MSEQQPAAHGHQEAEQISKEDRPAKRYAWRITGVLVAAACIAVLVCIYRWTNARQTLILRGHYSAGVLLRLGFVAVGVGLVGSLFLLVVVSNDDSETAGSYIRTLLRFSIFAIGVLVAYPLLVAPAREDSPVSQVPISHVKTEIVGHQIAQAWVDNPDAELYLKTTDDKWQFADLTVNLEDKLVAANVTVHTNLDGVPRLDFVN